ncbi:MAG: hypothetical protein VX874_05590 [Pseudomonadota bacterium]|nr:hypothetical protein [Pseudomonadota bacterium]
MSADLSFPGPNAPRTIFVFKLDIDPSEVEAWSKPDEAGDMYLEYALGVKKLDPAHVEVFPVSQIREFGLTRYLTDASGMSVESVAADAKMLSSLRGVIVLVHNKAVSGEGAFAPRNEAEFVGRYSEAQSLTVASTPASLEATRGMISGGSTPGKAPSRMPWGVLLISAAAIILIAAIIMGIA